MQTPFIRPDVRQFLDLLESTPAPKMPDVGAVQARLMLAQMRSVCDLDIGHIAVLRDIDIPSADGRSIPARLFDSRLTRAPGNVLMYFHGGGFVVGDLDHYQSACAQIARELDLPVIAVEYRLAPEAPWPAGPDDCEAASRWVATSPAALDRQVTGLIVAGDSAGGALALVTVMALRDHCAVVPVVAQMLLYPVTDLDAVYPSHAEFHAGYLLEMEALKWFYACYAANAGDWRASPMKGSLEGLPPMVLVTAGLDPLRDEGRAFAAAAIKSGVPTIFCEAAGMIHGFLNFRKAIPSAADDLHGCLLLLRSLLEAKS